MADGPLPAGPGGQVCLSPLATGIVTVALLGFVVATRWPLAPRYLYYFDSANFALSLERFNPALHQPQPPGYPLFVALIRFIHLWVTDAQHVLLIAGLLAAGAAILLIRVVASDLFGPTAGILAMTLLASNPSVLVRRAHQPSPHLPGSWGRRCCSSGLARAPTSRRRAPVFMAVAPPSASPRASGRWRPCC